MKDEPSPEIDATTKAFIGGAFAVGNALGHGFLETVYKNALAFELETMRFTVTKEKTYPVLYRNQKVGTYIADLVVNDIVIIELKCVEALAIAHSAQLLNYLKARNVPVGLLFNFGKPRVEVKRIIL